MAQTDMKAVIVKDIQDLPPDKLEAIHNYIMELKEHGPIKSNQKAELMALAGSWAEMSEEEYQTFIEEIVRHRQEAFAERPRDEIGIG